MVHAKSLRWRMSVYNFDLLKSCSQIIAENTSESHNKVREICIRVLEMWNEIDVSLRPIWIDFFDAIGFYPYIEKEHFELSSVADRIRKESYRSDYIDGVIYHSEQKKIIQHLLKGDSVIISAPTSFGKSILIEELVASKKYKNIVVIQPTLALLDETRMRLKKYADDYYIIVRTTQKPSLHKGNLFLLTAERVMEYSDWPVIDFLVIDEFYKLSLRREDPRAATLNNAFLRIVGNYNCPFYMLGPNIESITPGFAEKYKATFIKTNYALVDCDVVDKSDGIIQASTEKKRDKIKLERLVEVLDTVQDEQTLVYCSSPVRARRFARLYYDHLCNHREEPIMKNHLSDWIRKNISSQWSLAEEVERGIAFHDGSLPKHIGSSIIRYFNQKQLKIVFCTSTIIEGVNTSAKNVVLLDNTKGSKPIDFFDYNNIKGRSGRFMEHYVGRIFNIAPIPKEETTVIDIPLYGQNPIVDEILINIPRKDVTISNRKRKDQIEAIPTPLKEIIRRNGISIIAQQNMLQVIQNDIVSGNASLYQWSRVPPWNSLVRILEIAGDVGKLIDFSYTSGVLSAKQLALYLFDYGKVHSLNVIVEKIYSNITKQKSLSTIEKNRQTYYDQAIEKAFHIYRHLFQFTVPKAITVIDTLQRYAFELHGFDAGSYTFYVQQLENDFIDDRLAFLIEYGLPPTSAEKLVTYIGSLTSESEIIDRLRKNFDIITSDWMPYEVEQLQRCL